MRTNLRHENSLTKPKPLIFLNTLKKAFKCILEGIMYPKTTKKQRNNRGKLLYLVNVLNISTLTKNTLLNRLVYQLRFVSIIETKTLLNFKK